MWYYIFVVLYLCKLTLYDHGESEVIEHITYPSTRTVTKYIAVQFVKRIILSINE